MLDGIKTTKLKIISSIDGMVMHGVKKIDDNFIDFGEMYFSTVKYNSIKAWKLHKQMTMNLIVPSGEVLFNFFDERKNSKTYQQNFKILLSIDNYLRLTVPPKIWFGFKGISKNLNLICNVSNIIHNDNEVARKDINEIKTDWSNF